MPEQVVELVLLADCVEDAFAGIVGTAAVPALHRLVVQLIDVGYESDRQQ
jgi:hypothetical protein